MRSGGRSYTIIITVTDINRVAQEKLFVNAFLFAAEKKHPMYYSVKICYTDSRKVDLSGTFAPGIKGSPVHFSVIENYISSTYASQMVHGPAKPNGKRAAIIGSGPAGLTAAIYAARACLSVLVLEKEFVSGGQVVNTYEVDNYPGYRGISGFDLGMKFREHAEKLDVEFVMEAVERVDLEKEEKIIYTDQSEYHGRTVILAMGASHRKLEVRGEEDFSGMGVSYCATCDGAFFKGKTVAVVGGGDVAIEDAIFLSKGCEKVYLIHRRNQLRGAESLQRELFARPNIEVIWDSEVTRILGEDQVESVHLKNTENGEKRNLPVEGLFVAVGVVPCTTLIKGQVALDDFGYVKAREDCVTNIPGVFAAGDLRTKPMKQIVTAVADGANAVNSARNYLTKKE